MQLPPVYGNENNKDSNDSLSRQSSAALNTPANFSSILKRSKKSASVSPSDALLLLIGERIATSRQEDEFDYIGKNVASKLRKMTPEMEVVAEKLIHDVLYEGMTGTLKPTTKLISSEPVFSVP